MVYACAHDVGGACPGVGCGDVEQDQLPQAPAALPFFGSASLLIWKLHVSKIATFRVSNSVFRFRIQVTIKGE